MVNDSKGYELDLYQIETKPKLEKKKIIIIIAIIILLLCIGLTINNIRNIIIGHKVYKQYEAQINFIKQEEIRLAEEAERKRQEKIPKLTEVRNTKYSKYL